MNPLLKENLVAEGLWKGTGFAVIYYQANPLAKLLGTTLHECSHLVLASPPGPDVDTPAEDLAEWREAAQQWGRNAATPNPDFPNWAGGHGEPFTRVALHLHFRAWQAGYEIGLPEMNIAGANYELSPSWRFMHALGDEPRRMANLPFAEILDTKSPQPFRDLFEADAKRWLAERQAANNGEKTC